MKILINVQQFFPAAVHLSILLVLVNEIKNQILSTSHALAVAGSKPHSNITRMYSM